VTILDPQPDLCSIALARWFDDLADVGILVTDDTLTIRAWNPWLVALTGIANADAVGRPLFAVCPTIAARGLDQLFRDALAGEVRVLAHRLHGFLIPAIKSAAAASAGVTAQTWRIAPLTVNQRVVGTITILEDVSERVASDRELRMQILAAERARAIAEDASRLKDEFLATLSHEIRTPLNAVLGWVRILRTQENQKSPAHALKVIEKNAVSQLRLVEDLLDTARVISGKLKLEIAPLVVQDVMQAAIDAIEPDAAAKMLTIQTWFDPARPTVNADADRLQQALWNVLSNAVKFTPRDGRIDVRIARVADLVEVTVTDSGQGIAAGFLPYVFDRFRQADGSPSRRHGGLGLGLALVRHIVELHGGRVSVDSPGVNKGASFLVSLPAAVANAAPAHSEPRSASRVALTGVAIIIVEDSHDGREMLEVALRGYGATILALDSGEAALRVLSEEQPPADVLISDIGMPGLDGYELIRRVRSLPTTVRDIPAIAVSAYASPEERLLALAAGYQAHVSKPIDPALVGETVSRLLSASRRIPATK